MCISSALAPDIHPFSLDFCIMQGLLDFGAQVSCADSSIAGVSWWGPADGPCAAIACQGWYMGFHIF